MERNGTQAKSRINRRNYSRISGSLELPNLVEIQTNSFEWFKNEGIKEVYNDVYPISRWFTGHCYCSDRCCCQLGCICGGSKRRY